MTCIEVDPGAHAHWVLDGQHKLSSGFIQGKPLSRILGRALGQLEEGVCGDCWCDHFDALVGVLKIVMWIIVKMYRNCESFRWYQISCIHGHGIIASRVGVPYSLRCRSRGLRSVRASVLVHLGPSDCVSVLHLEFLTRVCMQRRSRLLVNDG